MKANGHIGKMNIMSFLCNSKLVVNTTAERLAKDQPAQETS